MEDLHPSVIIGVLAMAALYIGAVRLTGRKVARWQAAAFAGALIVILLSLCGPLDELEDDRLFVAHMAQHLMLCLAMPPLLLLGLTDWMVRPFLLNRWIRPLSDLLCNPLVAFLIYNAMLVAVHSPGLYDLMCHDDAVHIAFHLLMMATGVMLWWPLLSPLPELPRLSYPAQILYLFRAADSDGWGGGASLLRHLGNLSLVPGRPAPLRHCAACRPGRRWTTDVGRCGVLHYMRGDPDILPMGAARRLRRPHNERKEKREKRK